ncbi:response regulator [Pseudomonas sp. SO81]|jgi:DNA-binding response OmpR family regulator|uniref:response regulator n=1 Tax=Pseudomonas sp. SO81 TaxID=2983246 RepID=UPI0025A407D9|nr:response regulator [Pseudomonas sp. SO81]WJN58862.1 CheY-like receiver [Pseudomonas sp. SO81]
MSAQINTKRRVLLVDDDRMVRLTAAMLLEDLGYHVSEAASAQAALNLVDLGFIPELLITDFTMPQKNGLQLAKELRQRFANLPVLIITGYAKVVQVELEGFELLEKPFLPGALEARISALLH